MKGSPHGRRSAGSADRFLAAAELASRTAYEAGSPVLAFPDIGSFAFPFASSIRATESVAGVGAGVVLVLPKMSAAVVARVATVGSFMKADIGKVSCSWRSILFFSSIAINESSPIVVSACDGSMSSGSNPMMLASDVCNNVVNAAI